MVSLEGGVEVDEVGEDELDWYAGVAVPERVEVEPIDIPKPVLMGAGAVEDTRGGFDRSVIDIIGSGLSTGERVRGKKESVGRGVAMRLVSLATISSSSVSLGKDARIGELEIMMDGRRGGGENCGVAMIAGRGLKAEREVLREFDPFFRPQ